LSVNATDRPRARRFDEGSYAVLAVPVDWGARVGSAAFRLKLDRSAWEEMKFMGLMKIRTETDGEIVLSLSPDGPFSTSAVRFEWIGERSKDEAVSRIDNVEWTSNSRYGCPSV
jgi:hypothetical protein